jgi:tRNA (guanine37-N1)-methyltransferase
MSITPWHASVITLMPEMYPGPLEYSLIGDALEQNIFELSVIPLRQFGIGKHQVVDDSPYGGGAGMVLKPDVMDSAIIHAKTVQPEAEIIYLTPRGEPLKQQHFSELIQRPAIFLCGRYEAIDERVIEKYQPREISLGDFVLTGGDIAAMAIIDGCVRLLPGVIGDAESLREESFGLDADYCNLLEYPHYTKPAQWEGRAVPEILTSGHHANVARWRQTQAEALTKARRSDLWQAYQERLTRLTK